mgnify:FL=1|jgi:hypothetical protein
MTNSNQDKSNKTIGFAYFGDGVFIGWYSDSFGTITSNRPKLYTYSANQIATVKGNFIYGLSQIQKRNTPSENKEADNVVDAILNVNRKDLSQYKNVELRIVECPYYDGVNPNYNEEKYKEWKEDYKAKNNGNIRYADCPKELESWIYADKTKVREWAEKEPTEFIEVVTSIEE